MADLICIGLVELLETRELQNSCRQWDSNLQHSVYEADTLTIVPRFSFYNKGGYSISDKTK